MKKFIWTLEYSVGIESIDEQHQHFFDIANKILELADSKDSDGRELFESLEELGNYAFYHLKTEEDYFDKFKYPDAAEHIAEHDKFRDQIKKYFDTIKEEGIDMNKIGKDAAIFSGNWLYHHILLVDKKYTKFFIEKGLE